MSTPEPAMAVGPRTNLIDAVIAAARLYRAYLWPLLGASLFLQAAKIGLIFLSFELVGEPGIAGGGRVGAVMLVLNGGLAARFLLDVRAGTPPADPLDLLWRTAPLVPGLLWVLVLWSVGVGLGILLFFIPGLVLAVGWVLVVPVRVAQGDISGKQALVASLRLSRHAKGTALFLFLASVFMFMLIPALADSAVGRQAPIHEWWVAEASIATLLSPLLALTTAVVYVSLVDEYGPPELPEPQPTLGSLRAEWRPPTGVRPERIREYPAGLEKATIRKVRNALLFGMVPAVVIMALGFVAATQAQARPSEDAVTSFLWILMGSLAGGLGWYLYRGMVPYLSEVEMRKDRGVPVQAVVSRIVAYRPRFTPSIALPLQMLRYHDLQGVEREAVSQIREVRLVPGEVIEARLDPDDPLWITVVKPIDAQLRTSTRIGQGMLVAAALSILIGVASWAI